MEKPLSFELGRLASRVSPSVVVWAVLVLGAVAVALSEKPGRAAPAVMPAVPEVAAPAVPPPMPEAERAELARALQNPKVFPDVRLQAMDRLLAAGEPMSDEWRRLRADLQQKVAANQAALERSRLAHKRAQGVSVGASMQDALESSWGKPQRVNRTITAQGTREQWVYGGGNYLYFDGGVLTAIQTGP